MVRPPVHPLALWRGSCALALAKPHAKRNNPPTPPFLVARCIRVNLSGCSVRLSGAVARSLATLPLLVRAVFRYRSSPSSRSALRLKKGASILLADFVGVYALPLVAPLRVSLYWHFFCIIDHSALFNGVALPLAQRVAPFLRSHPSECPAPPVK